MQFKSQLTYSILYFLNDYFWLLILPYIAFSTLVILLSCTINELKWSFVLIAHNVMKVLQKKVKPFNNLSVVATIFYVEQYIGFVYITASSLVPNIQYTWESISTSAILI